MKRMKKQINNKKKYCFVILYGSGEGQLNNCNCNLVLNC